MTEDQFRFQDRTRTALANHLPAAAIDDLEMVAGLWVMVAKSGARGAAEERPNLRARLKTVRAAAKQLEDALAAEWAPGRSVVDVLHQYMLAKGRFGPLPTREDVHSFVANENTWSDPRLKPHAAVLAALDPAGPLLIEPYLMGALVVKFQRDYEKAADEAAREIREDADELLSLTTWGTRPPDQGLKSLVATIKQVAAAHGVELKSGDRYSQTSFDHVLRAVLEDVKTHVSDVSIPGDFRTLAS